MPRPILLTLATAGLLLLGTAPAEAQASACTIATTSVAFGNYDVFNSSPVSSTGTVTIRCGSAARNVSVTLSQGQSGSFASRSLRKSTESLSYNLYRDAACTSIWGDGSGGTSTYTNADPPNNTNITLTVYGQIPAAQDVSAGAYTDTVVATVNF